MSDKQDLEPLLNVRQNQLGTIIAQGDGIDNKSLGVFAADVALLIFVFGTISNYLHVLIAAMPVAISIIFAGLALQPKKYRGASVDLDDHPEYLAMGKETLVLQLLADTQKAIKYNESVNRTHWRRTLLSAGTAALGAGALFVVL